MAASADPACMASSADPLLDSNGAPKDGVETANDEITGDGNDILQFSTQIFFGDESEEKVRLGVMRLGRGIGRVKCSWETQDGSAKAGDQYVAAQGEIVFQDGDVENQSLWIDLLNDDKWHASNEFKVKLSKPKGCMLGGFLHTSRVKVLDNNLFPADTYPEVVMGEDALAEVSGVGLFLQYFMLNCRQPGMTWRTVLTLILDQMGNLNILLNRWMSLYMIDVVFNKDPETEKQLLFFSDKLTEAFLLASLYVIPMVFLHLWDYMKLQMDIKGHAKAFIRKNFTNRYLNYASESRDQVDNARITIALLDDVEDIAEGYCAVLDFVASACTVTMLVAFTLQSNPGAWWVVAVMPCLMLTFVFLRAKVLPEPTDAGPFKKSLVEFIREMVENYKLIVFYNQRPKINEQMTSRVAALRKNEVPGKQCSKNDDYFPSWLGSGFVCLYILLEAPAVLRGDEEEGGVSLGAFIATIRVIKDVANAFSILYTVYLTVIGTFDPVRDLTYCFNLRTDLQSWKELNETRRKVTREARQQARETNKGADSLYATDIIELKFKDVCFEYQPEEPILKDLNLAVKQGSVVGVLGGHGSGKNTLLQILGHSLFPSTGSVFVPGHLRLLQVTREPMMFESWSIWENLTFGVNTNGVNPGKVMTILEELRMDKTAELVKEHLEGPPVTPKPVEPTDEEEEEEDPLAEQEHGALHWVDHLNSSERAKLHLARALITNPEVLILHMPFVQYDKKMMAQVKEVLHMHRDQRGMGNPQANLHHRRPRSVIYSVMNPEDCEGEETIWKIEEDKTVSVRTAK